MCHLFNHSLFSTSIIDDLFGHYYPPHRGTRMDTPQAFEHDGDGLFDEVSSGLDLVENCPRLPEPLGRQDDDRIRRMWRDVYRALDDRRRR
jgi:hypothetical protein